MLSMYHYKKVAIMIISIFSILFLLAFSPEKPQNTAILPPIDTCRSIDNAMMNMNKEAVIFGRIQKYTPIKEGKGAGHMFWQWEVKFPGSGKIPVISKHKQGADSINFAAYENQYVIIHGTIFFGIIIGDSNPEHQSATGFRIDAVTIQPDESKPGIYLDTCRVWADIETHWNKDAYIAGKIIEYIPPHDSSKLGDEKIWDWEIQTADNYSIPLTAKNKLLNINNYIGKNVIVKAYILYGIIFGSENTANMRGTRVDAEEIYFMDPPGPKMKIKFDLDEFNDDGLRERPEGDFHGISYEFCIPADEEIYKEVLKIDSTAGVMKGSKGRSGCSDKEWLCIGSSRQPGFKQVILKLAELNYIRQINETFWE